MIIQTYKGDVFQHGRGCKNVVFAVNTEDFNDAGFAGKVARRFDWPSLMKAGETPLGTILAHEADGYTFYGVCCHSLHGAWDMATITKALDELPAFDPGNEPAVVWMGHGVVGAMQGVNPLDTKAAIEASKTPCYLYHL